MFAFQSILTNYEKFPPILMPSVVCRPLENPSVTYVRYGLECLKCLFWIFKGRFYMKTMILVSKTKSNNG